MIPVQPLPATRPLPASAESKGAELHVRLEDSLASARRLWVRGRVLVADAAPAAVDDRRWWERWRARTHLSEQPTHVQIETRLSGNAFPADVPLHPDLSFEALLQAPLPVARRGWRIARHRLVCAGASAEACSVVLEAPRQAHQASVVLLPLEYTFVAGGAQRFTRSDFPARWTRLLRALEQGRNGSRPLYYLACVPSAGGASQAELALAVTALGWPAGYMVPVTGADAEHGRVALASALERLRWLFAGQLELLVLNLEPSAAKILPSSMDAGAELAPVTRLVNPEDDPWTLVDGANGDRRSRQRNGLRPTRAGRLTRFPIVFCHGMLAFTMLKMKMPEDVNCFSPLKDFLRQRGYRVLFPQVPPTSGVVERAQRLREQILSWTDEPINLIAHSMGGLDARHMITHLDMATRVRSLTTVCTPHRGTFLAEWFLDNFRQRVPLLLALETLGINVDGFRDCRRSSCRKFNASTPDRPEVHYFSFGGEVPPSMLSPVLRRAWSLLTAVEGPNDGMVSVASARWGEYLGTVHADHFAQTPDGVFVRPGEDFDSLGFFLQLLEELARRGF